MTNRKSKIAVIGGGASGCAFSCFAEGEDITIFEKKELLNTILVTGGGRCNLAHAQYNFKELAENYPRGEKFLYSVFSKFSTNDTIKFFNSIGIKTYTQDDNRIFPISNKACDVRNAMINNLQKNGVKIVKEKVIFVTKAISGFILNNKYKFDKIVIATGGHSGYDLAKQLGHSIVAPKPSLVGLKTKEQYNFAGISFKDIKINVNGQKKSFKGDLLFTDKGVSGPVIFVISSIFARENYSNTNPLKLNIDFEIENFQEKLNQNGRKNVKNFVSEFIPKKIAEYICKNFENKKCSDLTKENRIKLEDILKNFPLTVIAPAPCGEIVTSGGVSLNEINSKTMESKIVKDLYFCGEVMDIDGFCGGFNLQNAWSTAYVASESIKNLS